MSKRDNDQQEAKLEELTEAQIAEMLVALTASKAVPYMQLVLDVLDIGKVHKGELERAIFALQDLAETSNLSLRPDIDLETLDQPQGLPVRYLIAQARGLEYTPDPDDFAGLVIMQTMLRIRRVIGRFGDTTESEDASELLED